MEIKSTFHFVTVSTEELQLIRDVIVIRLTEMENMEPEQRREANKETCYTALTKIHAEIYLYEE